MYTEINIQSFQRIAFSHSLATAHYRFDLENHGYGIYGPTPPGGGVLEIGFVEQNPILLRNGKGEFLVEENCIFVIPPDSSFSVRAVHEDLHRHASAEFLIRGDWREVEAFAPPEDRSVTLPLVITPGPGVNEIFSLIRNIACAKTTKADRGYFEECADFMLLIHKLSYFVQNCGSGNGSTPGNRRYCERAKAYVSEHIDRKIRVGDVAAAVGVSKNYLTNVFSSSEGIPLIEYINRRKLSYMVELIRRYHYTIPQAGEHVGLTDANYISRIFKRYYGMTISEYKQNNFVLPEHFKKFHKTDFDV